MVPLGFNPFLHEKRNINNNVSFGLEFVPLRLLWNLVEPRWLQEAMDEATSGDVAEAVDRVASQPLKKKPRTRSCGEKW